MRIRPRVLFTTPILRHPAVGGPYLRIENSIKALSRITELYIYSRVIIDDSTGLSFYKSLCQEFYCGSSFTPISRYIRFSERVLNYFAGNSLRELLKRYIFSKADFQDLLDVADAIKADLIWLGHGQISYPLLRYIKNNSNYKVVLDTDSVWSRFILRGLPFAKTEEERQRIEKEGRKKEEEERWGTQLADVTTAVSEVDADYYRNLAKNNGQIHIFSNAIDIETYQHTPPPPDNLKKPYIYLAGTFWPQSPMDDAARWVIQRVLPLVRQQIPDIRFYIVGTGSKRTLFDINDPNIIITGEVPSVLPYLCYADVALVPLRFESGTRFKILEAGACTIPVVSTTLGAEGLCITHEKNILIADEAESFSDFIVRLINNREFAKQIGQNLKRLVCEKYSLKTLVKEGQEILDYLSGK